MHALKLLFASTSLLAAAGHAAGVDHCQAKAAVEKTVRPLMEKHGVPGMAIGVTVNGHRCLYNFGVMSKATKQGVTDDTLFEIGSISKMFTATLATFAQADGKLALSDSPGKYLPSLRGGHFDKASLLNLGTYTAGGLPLQIPGNVGNTEQLMTYYKNWKSDQAPGASRTYSNPSIGMLGLVVADSLQVPLADAMEKQLFPALGLKHTYLNVPAGQMAHYAQGYTRKDEPVRVNPSPVTESAYGIKTTAADLLRFVALNMQSAELDAKWQRAIADTHIPYFQVGEMMQAFSWELYPYPVTLDKLLAGNSDQILFETNPVQRLGTTHKLPASVLMNKTGSTAGFANYVAFVPARKIGVVMLSNKSYPIAARVTAGHDILAHLESQAAPKN